MKFIPFDIGTFLVRSRTRRGHHIVDILEGTCSCEGYQHYRTCEHIKKALKEHSNLTTIVAFRAKHPMTCPLL